MKLQQFLIIIVSSIYPIVINAITFEELQNWFENIQKFNTKCSLRGNISDTVPLSKPVLEVTNCGGLNDISNYDFKVFLTFKISNNIQKYTYITYLVT